MGDTAVFLFGLMECLNKVEMTVDFSFGWLFLAYQIRKSESFTWDRNAYLTHLILPMGRIEKEKCHM